MISRQFDQLAVHRADDRAAMGLAAGQAAAAALRAAIAARGQARLILAAAPSQNETLAALRTAPDLDWSRVTILHMDEYLGLAAGHPATFRAYLAAHFLDHVRPAAFHGIAGETTNPTAECARYTALLTAAPVDVCCFGIGENGHLAFNDPPVADFTDPAQIKIVQLDPACRAQQVHDGCFPTLDAVPTHALTLTIPALLAARLLIGSVPGPRKADAVRATLHGPIATACPASILRQKPGAHLYVDSDSAPAL